MWRELLANPAVEPVSLLEAKNWGIVEHDEWDPEIYLAQIAARQHVENVTGRAIVRQQWRLYFDGFQKIHYLLPHTVQEVEAVRYIDSTGTEQVLDPAVYTVDIPQQRLFRAYDQTWPTTRAVPNAVYIDVWAGFYKVASPIDLLGDIPEAIKLAIKMMIVDVTEHRSAANEIQTYTNPAFEALLAPYRTIRI